MSKQRIRAKYPDNWKEVSRQIREERAGRRCECVGECGLHQPKRDGSKRRCTEVHMAPAKFAGGKVVLTTAHLCDCDPLCGNPEHLKAMCNRCHLRIDVALHQEHRKRNQRIAREKAGQQCLTL